MTAVTATQLARMFDNGAADRVCLYRVANVSYQDTIDLGPSGALTDFHVIKSAVFLATTATQIYNPPGVEGAVVTVGAGLTNDAGYLMVWGAYYTPPPAG